VSFAKLREKDKKPKDLFVAWNLVSIENEGSSLGVKTTCSAVEITLKLALAQSRDASVKVGVAARVQGTGTV
jgi:hypothetical protein